MGRALAFVLLALLSSSTGRASSIDVVCDGVVAKSVDDDLARDDDPTSATWTRLRRAAVKEMRP